MIRTVGCAGTLLLSTLGMAGLYRLPQAEAKITLTVQATPASKALAQLGTAANLQFTTSPGTKDEILTFRFVDAPISEAMKRIAEAVDGSWKQEGDSYRLIRTPEQQRAEAEAEFNQTVARLRNSIQVKKDQLAKLPAWSSDESEKLAERVQSLVKAFNPAQTESWYQQVAKLSAEGPIGRAIAQIGTLLDPRELAGLSYSYKTVWSSNPTPTQRPLSPGMDSVIEQFIKNQADWATAVQNRHLSPPSVQGNTYWMGDFGNFQDLDLGKVSIVLVTAQRWHSGGGFLIELSAFNEKGKKVATAQTRLGNDFEDYQAAFQDPPRTPGEKLVALEADGNALLESGPRRGSIGGKPLPPELIAKLLHPDQIDPLRFFLSPMLVQAAQIKNVNMVGCLGDSMLFGGILGFPQGLSADRFLHHLSYMSTSVESSAGWIVVRPAFPIESREARTDRTELARYLQRIVQGTPLSLDEQAAFALGLPDQQVSNLPATMAAFLKSSDTQYVDSNMIRLYGTLTAEQQTRMTGNGLPIGDLKDSQREYVRRMVYGMHTYLEYVPPPGGAPTVNLNTYFNGLMHEPTESLPDGLPAQSVVRLKVDSSLVVVAAPTSENALPADGRSMDPNGLAWQKFCQEHTDLYPMFAEPSRQVNFSKLRFGRRRDLTFTFAFTPNLQVTQMLEDRNPVDFAPVTLDDLPSDFKKKFQDSYDNLKQLLANGQLRFNTKGTPPPP